MTDEKLQALLRKALDDGGTIDERRTSALLFLQKGGAELFRRDIAKKDEEIARLTDLAEWRATLISNMSKKLDRFEEAMKTIASLTSTVKDLTERLNSQSKLLHKEPENSNQSISKLLRIREGETLEAWHERLRTPFAPKRF